MSSSMHQPSWSPLCREVAFKPGGFVIIASSWQSALRYQKILSSLYPYTDFMFGRLDKCALWQCCCKTTNNTEFITTGCSVQYLFVRDVLMFWNVK